MQVFLNQLFRLVTGPDGKAIYISVAVGIVSNVLLSLVNRLILSLRRIAWKIGVVIYLLFFIATPILVIVGITGALLERNFQFLYWGLAGMLLFSIVMFRAVVLLIGLFQRGKNWLGKNEIAILTRDKTSGEIRQFGIQQGSHKRLGAPRE